MVSLSASLVQYKFRIPSHGLQGQFQDEKFWVNVRDGTFLQKGLLGPGTQGGLFPWEGPFQRGIPFQEACDLGLGKGWKNLFPVPGGSGTTSLGWYEQRFRKNGQIFLLGWVPGVNSETAFGGEGNGGQGFSFLQGLLPFLLSLVCGWPGEVRIGGRPGRRGLNRLLFDCGQERVIHLVVLTKTLGLGPGWVPYSGRKLARFPPMEAHPGRKIGKRAFWTGDSEGAKFLETVGFGPGGFGLAGHTQVILA